VDFSFGNDYVHSSPGRVHEQPVGRKGRVNNPFLSADKVLNHLSFNIILVSI
jgi:hypothetical protein